MTSLSKPLHRKLLAKPTLESLRRMLTIAKRLVFNRLRCFWARTNNSPVLVSMSRSAKRVTISVLL